MKANDEIAQDHINFLEAQLLVLEVENEVLKEEVNALKVEFQRMFSDREYLP